MYYDKRRELGNKGLTEPVEFTRDDMQYMPSAFQYMKETLVKIDIWPAIDVTGVVLGYETKLHTYAAVFNVDHYDVTFDVSTLTDAEAYAEKEAEIDAYGDALIDAAYASPAQGVVTNSGYHKKVVNRRKSNRADKMAGDTTLSEAEKEESKMDEKLSEYETKITKDQDKAFANLYKLSGVDSIMSFDVAQQNWSTWTPPI